MTAPGAISGETEISGLRAERMGLAAHDAGTLNGSSPTANLAGVNIKGKWIVFHFPCGFR